MTVTLILLLAGSAAAQMGPGSGPWVVSTPESHGLSFEALQAADERTKAKLPNRVCHLVVKNGEIIYEAGVRTISAPPPFSTNDQLRPSLRRTTTTGGRSATRATATRAQSPRAQPFTASRRSKAGPTPRTACRTVTTRTRANATWTPSSSTSSP